MKKFKLSFLLLVLMSMMGNKAWADGSYCDGVVWSLSGTDLTITYTGSGTGEMWSNSWYAPGPWGSDITSVVIGDGVTSISNFAFCSCSRLTSITIPSSLTSIGERAFSSCSSLTSINIPDGVTSIGESAFSGCSGLAEVTFDRTTPPSIESNAFDGCYCTFWVPSASYDAYMNANGWNDKYEHTVLPIGTQTNYDVNVTAQNDRSGIYVEIGASNLKKVMTLKLTGTINAYDVMIMRDKMPNLHHLDLTNAIIVASDYEYYSGYSMTYDNVLPAYIFCNQPKLKSIKLPTSITSIGNYAFCNTPIYEISIPKEVTSNGSNAFQGCGNLTSLDLSNSKIQDIGSEAFYGCGLATVNLSNSDIQTIQNRAFSSCGNLVSVDFSNSSIRNYVGGEY